MGFGKSFPEFDYYDIVVVGAGPSGTTAARFAALSGAKVLVLEKDRDVGYPVRCGEAVSHEGLVQFIEPNPKWIASTVKYFKLVAPDGTVIKPNLNGFGYILERRIFDYELAKLAANCGAEIVTKAYVNGLILNDGKVEGVKVLLNNSEQIEIRAKIVIGADGVESRVGRWAGLNTTCKLQDMESAAQMTLTNIDIEPDTCYFYFGEKVAPGGYLWIFPKGENTANVGLGIAGIYGRQRHALSYLEEFVEKRFPSASILTVIAGGVPCAKTADKIVTYGLMLVGDAARQVNPVSGGGIISGMIGGKIAGQIAGEAIKKNDLNLIFDYENEWRKTLGQRHERYYKIKQFIYKFSDEKLNEIARELSKIPYENLTLKNLFFTAVKTRPSLIIEVMKLFI